MIGLLTKRGSFAVDMLVSSGGLQFAAVDLPSLKVPEYLCPYQLPTIRAGDTVVVVSGWLHDLQQQGVDVRTEILLPLRERFRRVVGLDQADPFQLDFSNDVMDVIDVVLKVNGVYADRELYNYVVGAPTPEGRWTEKTERRGVPYRREQLNKLQLSIPCFLGVATRVRRQVRRYYCRSAPERAVRDVGDRILEYLRRPLKASAPPQHTAHFYASLTHVQRAQAARKLRMSSIRWKGGITGVPAFVTGLRGNGMARLTPGEQRALTDRIAADGILTPYLSRPQYVVSMWDCKAVISIAGYGELCFRMAEAWANRRILVCQDLSHVRTLFPLVRGRNVVYCRPDLADLTDILDDIECNYRNYIDIAEHGHGDWLQWSGEFGQVLADGFAALYE